MSGYVCIAMLEDPPYNLYLAATEEEPEDWCAGLPLPSHLLCSEGFKDPQTIAKRYIQKLKGEGIAAKANKAFPAPPHELMRAFLLVRDAALREGQLVDPRMTQEIDDDEDTELGEEYFEQAQELELDDENRLVLMKKAAEAGYQPAIEEVIDAYHMGWGCEENLEEAVDWIIGNNIKLDGSQLNKLDGSQLNDFAHKFDLKDTNRLMLLKMAAEAGYSPAVVEVIEAYQYGWGCEEGSLEEAKRWIVENNIKIDINRLCDFAISCCPEEESDSHRQVKIKVLKALALSGHSKAIFRIAQLYYDGRKVERDCQHALLWAERLNGRDRYKSDIFDLGCMCDDIARLINEGKEIIPDPTKALKFFRIAAEHKYSPAYLVLSYAFSTGDGVRKDLNAALYWARKSKDTGCEYGYGQLARCYIEAGQKEKAADAWKQCFRELDIASISRILSAYAIDVTKRGLPKVHNDTIAKWFDVAILDLEKMDTNNFKERGVKIYSDTIAWLEKNKLAFAGHAMAIPPPENEKNPVRATQTAPQVKLQTSLGDVVFELNAEKAPVSVGNFLAYVKSGQYDGTIFHRVIPGFMAQGGGFTEKWKQKPTRAPIKNEADNGLRNQRGTIAMARTSDPQSATAQFFINYSDNAFLDYKSPTPQGWGYAVFGKVVQGMGIFDKMATVPTGAGGPMPSDVPKTPIVIKSATVLDK